MALRFTGPKEELQTRLNSIASSEEWEDINPNHLQFRHKTGGVMNWYPSTGSITFQGKPDASEKLRVLVSELLETPVGPTETAIIAGSVAVPAEKRESLKSERTAVPKRKELSKEVIQDLESRAVLGHRYSDSELVIGLVGAVGTELKKLEEIVIERLKAFKYETEQIRVSNDGIPRIVDVGSFPPGDEYARIDGMMNAGNEARKVSTDNAVLALGVASIINARRGKEGQEVKVRARHAYIVNSLKRPEEVRRLREIYPQSFFLIGVHSEEKRRHKLLTEEMHIDGEKAQRLMIRDEDEHVPFGQQVTATFHMSDFFVRIDGDDDRLKSSVWRILDIMFSHPYRTPTFDEYAMFLAFAASLRSADLSRQVGAVIAKSNEILSTGANDCPKSGGGLYWPEFNEKSDDIEDIKGGRDYTLGQDSNKNEQRKIIEEIIDKATAKHIDGEALREILQKSRIRDITEFGRMVHAEMEALLSCARNNNSTKHAELYCTTFPCHNCAKHIIAAGIKRVVFIEPYQKSKAAEFHSDAITLGFDEPEEERNIDTVRFEPFVGVGPRRFFDLFSMRLGAGYELKRKDDDGIIIPWTKEEAKLRIQMLPYSYLELEVQASKQFQEYTIAIKG
jgi:deoxycytidylate deaminase